MKDSQPCYNISMVIVSNNLFDKTNIKFPEDVVVRLNLAWIKDVETAMETLRGITQEIYLDYPQGRTKPPKPTLTLEEAIQIASSFKNVKYFAVSNVEEPMEVAGIRGLLPAHINFVPKIETKRGVKNLSAIVKAGSVKYAMLDKEDLYMDVGRDQDVYEVLADAARMYAKESGITLLELRGVVFV